MNSRSQTISNQEINLCQQDLYFDSETDLIILSYLPINEALNLTNFNRNLQIKLIGTYFANDESLFYFIKMLRFDLVKVLFDKNIGNIPISDQEQFLMILDLIRTNTKLKNLKIRYHYLMRKYHMETPNLKYLVDALLENKSITSFEIDCSNEIIILEDANEFIRLISNRKFEELCLCRTFIKTDVEIIRNIFDLPNFKCLKKLDLSSTPINLSLSVIISNYLSNNTSLTSIDLSENILGDSILLFKALVINHTLKSIILRGNEIKDRGVELLAESLKINRSITLINLSNNYVDELSVQFLTEALKINKTLTSVDLSSNYIKNKGAKSLASVLKNNCSLLSLNLNFNYITDEGIKDLAVALTDNNILTSINLSYNFIEKEGTKSIADALKVNKTLKRIDLSYNSIEKEVNLITEALKVNNSLTSINLSDNNIKNESIDSIVDLISTNTSLTYINISANSITAEGNDLIKRTINKKCSVRCYSFIEQLYN